MMGLAVALEDPPLAEILWIVGGCWEQGNHFSLRAWLLVVDHAGLFDYIHAHIGSSDWTQWFRNERQRKNMKMGENLLERSLWRVVGGK